MISDVKDPSAVQAVFGSGKLLSDLLEYNVNAKFIFVGDVCQLPPILQDISPALSSKYLKEVHNIDSIETTLTSIVRQQEDNTIIQASHRIRNLYQDPPVIKWGKLPLGNYKDIRLHTDTISMINKYLELIRGYSYERGTFISYSNSKCNNLNKLIRSTLGYKSTLQVGDLLLVTQNNSLSGFMNGDMVVIEQIKNVRYQRAQLTFTGRGKRASYRTTVYSAID